MSVLAGAQNRCFHSTGVMVCWPNPMITFADKLTLYKHTNDVSDAMTVFSSKHNQYQSCLFMSVETFLQRTLAGRSHCCQRAEDLQYGCQRLCCHLKALYWWWWSYTDTVHHGQCWLWERVFPFSTHRITSFFLTTKPRKKTALDPGPMARSNWLCSAGSVYVYVYVCVCVYFLFFLGGGVSVWGIHSLLVVLPTLPATHSFILWTTGTGRTWWILARLASTSRWTQSGWKEPLKPTNASLSAGRPNYITYIHCEHQDVWSFYVHMYIYIMSIIWKGVAANRLWSVTFCCFPFSYFWLCHLW